LEPFLVTSFVKLRLNNDRVEDVLLEHGEVEGGDGDCKAGDHQGDQNQFVLVKN